MNKSDITVEQIIDVFKSKNYKVFENQSKPYNINPFGIRTKDINSDTFNDFVGLFWKYQDKWNLKIYEATTDAGLYWRRNPMNVKGTGILVPDQYIGAFKIGLFHGYDALIQQKPFRAYRDDDRNDYLNIDPATIEEGMFGCEIHHAAISDSEQRNWNWSAMCQVIEKITDWNEFISICKDAVHYWGELISYTLTTENDFNL